MDLKFIDCPTCNKRIHEKAEFCPYCHPIVDKGPIANAVATLVLITLVVTCLVLGYFFLPAWAIAAATILLLFGIMGILKGKFQDKVDRHKANLIKGGLIPRASQAVHEEALSQLGNERPNYRLPHRTLFDE